MLGARIALLRKQTGLSQRSLAAALKVSPSAVGMYEQDRRTPSTELLIEMARLFDVSTDFLLTGCSRQKDAAVLNRILEDTRKRLRRPIERRAHPTEHVVGLPRELGLDGVGGRCGNLLGRLLGLLHARLHHGRSERVGQAHQESQGHETEENAVDDLEYAVHHGRDPLVPLNVNV